jgi:ribA/ribD-fused uncharacterized protein
MNVELLRERAAQGERFDFLLFWGHTQAPDGRPGPTCLSQWFPAPFSVDGCRYPTAEHWMMAEKARLFGDEETLERILGAPTPGAAKKLGRAVRNFDDARWKEKRFAIVVAGSLHKFAQNEPLASFLRSTGTRVLVEASPVDRIWGIGLSKDAPEAQDPRRWRGLNLLGFALMEARSKLRVQSSRR